MPTLQETMALLGALQNFPGLMIISTTIALLAMTVAVSGNRAGVIRLLYFCSLPVIALALASSLEGVNADFFMNIGTEIIGAMIVIFLLSDQIASQRWLFPLIFIFVIFSTLPIFLSSGRSQEMFVNTSTDLIGAFIIFILLQRREWLWNYPKRGLEKERVQLRQQLRQQAQEELARWIEQERKQIQNMMQREMETWRASNEHWDMAIKIAAVDSDSIKVKVKHLKQAVQNVKVLRLESDDDTGVTHCYLVATVPPPPPASASASTSASLQG